AGAHAAGDAQLSVQAQDEIPDLPTLQRFRMVQPRRAVRARALAGRAVAFAPAELPVGKGDETFFSASSIRCGARHRVWNASNTGQISSNASIPSGVTTTGLPSASPTPSQSVTTRRATALAMASAIC